MFNVTILRARDLIKFGIVIAIAVGAVALLSNIKIKQAHTETLGVAAPMVFNAEKQRNEENKIINTQDYMKNIINEQIASIGQIQNSETGNTRKRRKHRAV